MEHRYYPRIRISLEVDLFRRGLHIGNAITKDLSLGGMMLMIDEPVLTRNDVVMLRLWIQGEELTLRGFVIYTSQNHSGVMLMDMSRDATRAYFNFLRDMEVPLKAALDRSIT